MNFYIKIPCFSVERTLESGQCFRWRREEAPDGGIVYRGIAGSRAARIRQEADGITVFEEIPARSGSAASERQSSGQAEAVRSGECAEREEIPARSGSATSGGQSSGQAEAVRSGECAEREEIPARSGSAASGGQSSEQAEAVRFWRNYFDADTDYDPILTRFSEDETLCRAVSEYRGLRVLRQEPFETLVSFILSQNNNIRRIRMIIERLCETFGEPAGAGYGFPSPERLAAALAADFDPVRAGFRVRYVMDAAKKVAEKTVDLSEIARADYETGKALLQRILGVGAKVADCVLLFAFHKTDAFPTDVWIKRIMSEYYKNGLPECAGGEKGIAQQYLFEYFRRKPGGERKPEA